ncbi:titin homolog [Sabethes cyaneus]|uniref:titin homolog n=1 Tax=Sabethes cyaneus TaxID=53552 RepID=UPI00237DA71B|nr:titin homolog [Sabethes cyaneus]
MPITTPKVPDGLPELMKGLAKSVIKENPKNIYVHAAEYFESLIRDRDGELDKGYRNFSAHKVYADYRENCRDEKGNSSGGSSAGRDRSSSSGIQAQSDGDNEGSGGSATSASREKRKKRIRQQESKGSAKSVDKNDGPDLQERKKSATNSDENITEGTNGKISKESSIGKGLSIDAEAVANSVLTVLTETVLTSDEVNKDTKAVEVDSASVDAATVENLQHPINCEDLSSYPPEENVSMVNHEDSECGSAPSTAEAVEEVVYDGEDPVESAVEKEDALDLTDAPGETVEANENLTEEAIEPLKSFSEEAAAEHEPEGQDTVDTNTEAVEHVTNQDPSNEEMPNLPDVPTEEPTSEDLKENKPEHSEQLETEYDENVGDKPTDDSNRSGGESLEKVGETSSNDEPLPADEIADVPVEDGENAQPGSDDEKTKPAEESVDDTGETDPKSDDKAKLSENTTAGSNEELKEAAEPIDEEVAINEVVETKIDDSVSDSSKTNDVAEEKVDSPKKSSEKSVTDAPTSQDDSNPKENVLSLEESNSDPLPETQNDLPDSEGETPVDAAEQVDKTEEIAPTDAKNSIEKADDTMSDDVSANLVKEPSGEKSESEINASEQSEGISKESAKESEADGSEPPEGELSVNSRTGVDEESAEQLPQEELESLDNGVKENSSAEIIEEPIEPAAPVAEQIAEDGNTDNTEVESEPSGNLKSEKVEENTPVQETNSSQEKEDEANASSDKMEDNVESQDEVVEEPCIQREVPSSESKPTGKTQSTELEEIKKVDLASFDKNSAEALFYSLKKTELETEESSPKKSAATLESEEKDDDDDVIVTEETPANIRREQTKRTFTDDFLADNPVTNGPDESGASDGVDHSNIDIFNPMAAASNRSQQLLDQMHNIKDDSSLTEPLQLKPRIRRSMTEQVDLSRQDSEYVNPRKYDSDYVDEEDEFDGYYIGNIRNKILASSVSVADSDYYEPDREEEPMDDKNVRTALETIMSTDTESTLPSQTTVHANRGVLRKGSQTNIPYASFGNSAIDRSLDEFIEREEQHKEAEAQAASTIQRSYRQFQSNKRKLLRDYQSTMQTFTEDQSTESLEDYTGVIQVKVDQKNPEERSEPIEEGRSEKPRRPMHSLNIEESEAVARRTMLARGTAVQRNSTRDDESARSETESPDKKPSSEMTSSPKESPVTSSDLSADKKPSSAGSDEKENKDNASSRSNGKARLLSEGKKHNSLDTQKLFIARQRTMPVQIDSTLMRVLPKHMRKRNQSAGTVRK